MKTGIELIAEERLRQVSKLGWTAKHDDEHFNGELSRAAAVYAMGKDFRYLDSGISNSETPSLPRAWPWIERCKVEDGSQIGNLIKAGALIAAEIDRLNRC